MKIHKLPGNRGSFTKNGKRRFVYAVRGTADELAAYKAAKQAEGFDAPEDPDFGLLFYTGINVGREAELNVGEDGKIWASNQGIRDAQDLIGQVSQQSVDAMIIDAMNTGSYATKLVKDSVKEKEDNDLNP